MLRGRSRQANFETSGRARPTERGPRTARQRQSLLNTSRIRNLAQLLGRALTRPRLLALLARNAWRFRARGWWRRWPFLPLPPAEYLDWRLHTAYGDEGAGPEPEELERYLRWSLRMQRLGAGS